MPSLDARVHRIFLQAIAVVDERERSNLLSRLCLDDAELRKKVESLLLGETEQGDHYDQHATPRFNIDAQPPVPGNFRLQSSTLIESAGTQIHLYRLISKLGQGGMGTVWMAEQKDPIQRLVALKLIHSSIESEQALARFEAERQALAMMNHPAIAKVFDAGTTDAGRPFFVMEYVKGMPINAYCDQNRLMLQERIQLFITVCQAVQHAHQKGIIHRDLKPGNVLVGLVDGQATPKVIDFGVAKAMHQKLTDRTLYTEVGTVIGTLEYMAPEQAMLDNLDIDTRADLYALGVILYELVTGSLPLSRDKLGKSGLAAMVQAIHDIEPARPSICLSTSIEELKLKANQRRVEPRKLLRQVKGELDWIIMKCLEKDRSRRYETANGLALDLERYLKNEPVHAGPPSARYRLYKFYQRNRGKLLSVAAIFLITVITASLAVWQAIEATLAKEKAEKSIIAEKNATNNAKLREADTNSMLNFIENRIIKPARPDNTPDGSLSGQGRTLTLKSALESSLPYIDTTFAQQPLLAARLSFTLAHGFLALGEYQHAYDLCLKTEKLYEQELGEKNIAVLNAIHMRGVTLYNLGKHQEALELSQNLVPRMTSLLGAEHARTMEAMGQQAVYLQALGKVDQAFELTRQLYNLKVKLVGHDHNDSFRFQHSMANQLLIMGKFQEAYELQNEILNWRKENLSMTHPETLHTMMGTASALEALKRLPEALQLREQAIAIQEKHLGPDHVDTLRSIMGLANCLNGLGKKEEALQKRMATYNTWKKKYGIDHPDTLVAVRQLVTQLLEMNRIKEALKLTEESIPMFQTTLGYNNTRTLDLLHDQAAMYHYLGNHQKAYELRIKLLPLQQEAFGKYHKNTLLTIHGLATNLFTLQRGKDALVYSDLLLQQALKQNLDIYFVQSTLEHRMEYLESVKDLPGSLATAELWEKHLREEPMCYILAARLRARIANLMTIAAPTQDIDLQKNKAVDWLQKACKPGSNLTVNLKTHRDFVPLLDMVSFQKLFHQHDETRFIK